MRLKSNPKACAKVFTINVLANPGTPTNKACPPEKIDNTIWSITASCPTIILAISFFSAVLF